MIRRPAVAGTFYPDDEQALTKELARCTDKNAPKQPCIGAVVPHAGYMFSGAIAGELFSQIDIPPTVVILAPNHRGPLVPFALSPADSWRTPLGDVDIDKELAEAIAGGCPLVQYNAAPHANEHSAEVQVPFLQYFRPDVKIVPMVIGEHNYEPLVELGSCLAESVRGKNVLILASSDMTHFKDAQTAKQLDDMALEQILALDALALHQTVVSNRISMCGFAPAVAMITAAVHLGAQNAPLIRYGNSGDVTGDFSSVVGYASVRIF